MYSIPDAPHTSSTYPFFNPSSTASAGWNLRESDISFLCGTSWIAPCECPVIKATVASTLESATVKDKNFIAVSKFMKAEYVAEVKFMVYMSGVGRRWRKSTNNNGR